MLGRPAELLNAAQACGLLSERGNIRRAEERLALPQVGVIALGVVNSLPAAVGWNELKRNSFIGAPYPTYRAERQQEEN